jgi:hypothetical protein
LLYRRGKSTRHCYQLRRIGTLLHQQLLPRADPVPDRPQLDARPWTFIDIERSPRCLLLLSSRAEESFDSQSRTGDASCM